MAADVTRQFEGLESPDYIEISITRGLGSAIPEGRFPSKRASDLNSNLTVARRSVSIHTKKSPGLSTNIETA